MSYQPKTGEKCHCRPGVERDNCPQCEGTGWRIDFKAIRTHAPEQRAQAGHTPLPWFTGDDHPSVCVIRDGESIQICAIDTAPFSVGEPEANSALIVRAVNSHAALVEACLLIVAADGEDSSHAESLYKAAVSKARTALALAEGGAL